MLQVRATVRNLNPYTTDENPPLLRFHANESPYNLPTKIRESVAKKIKDFEFNHYPDADCSNIRELIAKQIGFEKENILLGNGSDELIGMIIQAFCGDDDKILIPKPTFTMYKQIAVANNVNVAEVKLNSHFDLPGNFFEKIDFFQPKVIFLSYPNNPTGNLFNEETIEKLLENDSILTVIDEAYFHFSDKTFIEKIREKKNLIILRSFSKVGLAGIRAGYLVADPEFVRDLNKVRLPYNINSFSQLVLTEALNNWDEIEKNFLKVKTERENLIKELSNFTFFNICKTSANFVLLKVNNFKTQYIFNVLRENDITVRYFEGSELLEHYIRVTVHKKKENTKLIKALQLIE
ncbi:MAG: histidinol-phosphate transaminase [Nitrospinae bacterium]|nr:histidinol-phosphate transaminase [Nitrospinota bacterium]